MTIVIGTTNGLKIGVATVEFRFGSDATDETVTSSHPTIIENGKRRSAESLLAKLHDDERPKLRVYIGAAPGVGKTY